MSVLRFHRRLHVSTQFSFVETPFFGYLVTKNQYWQLERPTLTWNANSMMRKTISSGSWGASTSRHKHRIIDFRVMRFVLDEIFHPVYKTDMSGLRKYAPLYLLDEENTQFQPKNCGEAILLFNRLRRKKKLNWDYIPETLQRIAAELNKEEHDRFCQWICNPYDITAGEPGYFSELVKRDEECLTHNSTPPVQGLSSDSTESPGLGDEKCPNE